MCLVGVRSTLRSGDQIFSPCLCSFLLITVACLSSHVGCACNALRKDFTGSIIIFLEC